MTEDFGKRFDSAYFAWLDKKCYLEAKGYYWDRDNWHWEPQDPTDLESEAVDYYADDNDDGWEEF